MGELTISTQQAINAIKSNRPTSGYSMLCEALDMAVNLLQAQQDGLLLRLPCTVGDTVYEVHEDRGIISTLVITSVCIEAAAVLFCWELVDGIYKRITGFRANELGKTVFLTRNEADAALKSSNPPQMM